MKKGSGQKILSLAAEGEFIGRTHELGRLTELAVSGTPGGISVLAAPGSGSSELLRQTYDRLFREQTEVIPFYFALRASDISPRDTAQRFLQDLLTQTAAFRRQETAILDASPELQELAELAVPADGHWFDRMIEAGRNDGDDERSYVRSLFSAPLRAAADGARIFVMIDDLHLASLMPGGAMVFEELAYIYGRAEQPFVFAGARRFLFGTTQTTSLSLEPLSFSEAGKLVEAFAEKYSIAVSDQSRDLIAVQLGGRPASIARLFAAAAEQNLALDTFRTIGTVYADEMFGGRISRDLDGLFRLLVPELALPNILKLIDETLASAGGRTPVTYWQKHAGIGPSEFSRVMRLLHIFEAVSVNSGFVQADAANCVLTDYVRGRTRLELSGSSRALVVGEATTEYLKRAPQMLARLYRRNSALGLRALLGAFDCQQVAAAEIDYAAFKAEIKGLSDDEARGVLEGAEHSVTLPQIVYTAHTAAFYSKIGELIDDERSTIALGFEESGYRDETVWIAAEIDSKLEATRELTEFWLDRLEMVAINCGFANYKMWLVAPEGFADEALAALSERGAYGSSRRQVDLLARRITGGPLAAPQANTDDYEMIIPMGEDTEMIAAHAVEEIAKRHGFPAKAINQIKTALVEACINATEHSLSPDRRIYQKFTVDAGQITITVANRGLRILDKTAREVTPDEGRRGWGLKLMKGLMDSVKIEQSDDGTRVTMVKRRPA